MPTIKIITPKKFDKKKRELTFLIKKHNPAQILEKTTKRKFKTDIILRHKPSKQGASFKNNTVYVDFNNSVEYIWLSLAHELAHILLRNPAWDKNPKIQKIVKVHKGFSFKYQGVLYQYTFAYATEQTIAILLQAVCEDKIGHRKLDWKIWEDTFQCMGVKKFGKKLWKPWLNYLANLPKYKNIDEWILEMNVSVKKYPQYLYPLTNRRKV